MKCIHIGHACSCMRHLQSILLNLLLSFEISNELINASYFGFHYQQLVIILAMIMMQPARVCKSCNAKQFRTGKITDLHIQDSQKSKWVWTSI